MITVFVFRDCIRFSMFYPVFDDDDRRGTVFVVIVVVVVARRRRRHGVEINANSCCFASLQR